MRTREELQTVNAFLFAFGRTLLAFPDSHCTSPTTTTRNHNLITLRVSRSMIRSPRITGLTRRRSHSSASLPCPVFLSHTTPTTPHTLRAFTGASTDTRRAPISPICIATLMIWALGLASGHNRKLAVSSLAPPPPDVSPISTSSSIGSSHATGDPASLEASHHLRSNSESHSHYIKHVGGLGHPIRTSFGGQVRGTSLSGGQPSAPSLGVREGSGLLVPQVVKGALRLQASPGAAAEREKTGEIREEEEEEDEDIDELREDASTINEEAQ